MPKLHALAVAMLNRISALRADISCSADSLFRMGLLALVFFFVFYWCLFVFLPGLRMDRHLRHIPTIPGKIPFLGHALLLIGGSPWVKMAKWSLSQNDNETTTRHKKDDDDDKGAKRCQGDASQVKGGSASVSKIRRIVTFNLFNQRVVYTNEPALLKRILLTNQRNYSKDIASSYKHFMCLLGTGLVTSEGEKWKRGRLLLSHALRIDIVKEVPEMTMRAVGRVMVKLAANDATNTFTDLSEEFRHMTLQVIGETALSLTAEETDRIFPALYLPIVHECNRRVWEPWRVLMFFSEGFQQRRHCLKQLNEVLCQIIETRWKSRNETHKRDVIALCMSQIDKMDSKMTLQLRDDVKTMLLAGHETSAALLTWATYELMCHPDIRREVVEEAKVLFDPVRCEQTVNTPYGKWGVPTADDVRKMLRWTPAVLRESLRRHSVVPLVMRRAVRSDLWPASETGLDRDVVIPAGCSVAVGIQGVHQRPDIWPEPDTFQPQRFMDAQIANDTNTLGIAGEQHYEKTIDPYAFIPFINGPRNCLGQHLAMVETQVALSFLFLNWNLRFYTPESARNDDNAAVKLSSLEEEMGRPHDYIVPIVPHSGLKVSGGPRLRSTPE